MPPSGNGLTGGLRPNLKRYERSLCMNICRGVWHSPDKQKTIKIKPTISSYYDITETHKRSKNVQHIKIGKEGVDQFIDELTRNQWVLKAR
jgi:hypothetical protein